MEDDEQAPAATGDSEFLMMLLIFQGFHKRLLMPFLLGYHVPTVSPGAQSPSPPPTRASAKKPLMSR